MIRLRNYCGLVLLVGVISVGHPKAYANSVQEVMKKASRSHLVAFESEAALEEFLKELAKAKQTSSRSHYKMESDGIPTSPSSVVGQASDSDQMSEESVTNTQHAGVDEGGIVKVHGNHLVMLRRGRLFTVLVGGNALQPVSAVNAFGPGINPRGTWYDELLVSGDTVVVIGYSYQRGGTEIGLFDINAAGQLKYRVTYHLRSNDYYSSRNYASRLIGNKLIFYAPLYLHAYERDPFHSFPALRKWHEGASDQEFKRIVSATRVYRPLVEGYPSTLHTVTSCDLNSRELECKATVVMGPPGRVFYVSPSSVYVWVTPWRQAKQEALPRSVLYRLPLNGDEPTMLRAMGSPVDQFSFLEEGTGYLNVLVRANATGDGMWRAEVAAGDVALMRVSLLSFTHHGNEVLRSQYTPLPKPNGYTFQNRFVGDYLIYGSGTGWGYPDKAFSNPLYVYRYAGGRPVLTLPVGHNVDRIEALGSGAIVIGPDDKDLHFTSITLGNYPSIASRYKRSNATQGELRSHGFFYKPLDSHSGLLGLPIRGSGSAGYEHLIDNSARILFLKNDAFQLKEFGSLKAKAGTSSDSNDKCQASCVDWYGNARPLFLQGRIFALLGYEIVEGRLVGNRIVEQRRVNFM